MSSITTKLPLQHNHNKPLSVTDTANLSRKNVLPTIKKLTVELLTFFQDSNQGSNIVDVLSGIYPSL